MKNQAYRFLAVLLFLAAGVGWAPPSAAQQGPSLTASLTSNVAFPRADVLARAAHLDVRDVDLSAALDALERSSGVHVSYNPETLPDGWRVVCACSQATVGEAVRSLLVETELEFLTLGDHVIIRNRVSEETQVPVDAHLVGGEQSFWSFATTPLVDRIPRPRALQGTITGQVVDARTLQPLAAVQVSIPNLGVGVISGDGGRFLLNSVPAGTHTLRAERLGYQASSVDVSVQTGVTTEVFFELETQALALDEIVVTGTAGQARRREVGTSVAQINMADRPEAIASVDQAFHGQTPGLLATRSTGGVGAGAQLRLRGSASVAMSNQPLIYIDGVRVRSQDFALNHAVGQHVAFGANETVGPLNDINPNDIERIEVVRGPAATALYGTEAAGGVIQIFTKRGTTGAPVWSASIDQGVDWVQPFGPEHEPYMRMDPWLRNAHQQRYGLSVSGGGQDVNYFVSGSYDDNLGTLPSDWEKKLLLRMNIGFTPLPDLDLQLNVTRTSTSLQNTTSGGNPFSLPLNVYRSPVGRPANYVGSSGFAELNRLLEHEILTDQTRFVTGLTATYSPMPRLTNRLTVGVDRIESDMLNTRPFGYIVGPAGSTSNQKWTNETLSVDYVGTFESNFTAGLRNSFSWGMQSVTQDEGTLGGTGDRLPGPGLHTVSAGATLIAREERSRVINAGFFLQNMFDLRDRYFLTLALRVDGNSAFGSGFGLQPYPRASLSYVVSDEGFWAETWGALRLRSAYGQAGRAPGAFDAVRTWTPLPWVAGTAFSPRNIGNPDLGPETTEELEAGFEWATSNQRFTIDFTYYTQQTKDALLPVTQAPSDGFGGTQLENVGTISNKGIELSIGATLLQRRETTWDMTVGISTNKSRVEDLGGGAPFSAPGNAWVAEGQPLPAIRGPKVLNPDEFAEPDVERNHIFGPNQPTHTLIASSTVSLPRGVVLSARGEFQGGHFISDGASDDGARRGATHPQCDLIYPILIEQGQRDQFTAWERWECDPSHPVATILIYPADFFRLREITVQAPVPFHIPGSSRASFSVSVQNALSWKNDGFRAMDPEMGSTWGRGNDRLARRIAQHVPAPASFRASLRVTF